MVPPANQAESCATGMQCNDTGRCTSPSQQLSLTSVMSAAPSAVITVPGGPAQSFSAKLTAFSSTAAVASVGTHVRVVGRDGAQVSCDAATYGNECALTSWTFAFDGKQYNSAHTVQVKTPAGTPDARGDVELRIDATDSSVIVPANASATALANDGEYDGTVQSIAFPGGIHVTARADGNYIVIRDPSRTLTADGFVIIDRTHLNGRQANWIQPVGANASAPGIVTQQNVTSLTTAGGQIKLSMYYSFSNDYYAIRPDLTLNRTGPITPQCAIDADCDAGNTCPAAIHMCVPTSAWNPPAVSTLNQFEDSRSVQWWNAISPLLGNGTTLLGAAAPAFAMTNAGVIESLMCTTTAGAGRLGVDLLEQPPQLSHSGDLTCVNDTTGSANGSPGAVGLVTTYDRTGSAISSDLLTKCLQDLARPVVGDFATNFAATTGTCVNLARVLPAIRLLATGELNKDTNIGYLADDAREVGLFVRLIQQWTSLTGFLVSTGLSQRELDDATGASSSTTRQGLLTLLDTADAGWAALLDKRVAPVIEKLINQIDESFGDYVGDLLDYRLATQPFLYWPFNDHNGSGMLTDVIRNIQLDGDINQGCGYATNDTNLSQHRGCEPYTARVSDTQRLDGFSHETVLFNINAHNDEYQLGDGGMIFGTAQLAIYQNYDAALGRVVLTIVHPTNEAPGYERVKFSQINNLRHDFTSSDGAASTLALVRDTNKNTYTLYHWENGDTSPDIYTQSYQHNVAGLLTGIGWDQLFVLGGPAGCFSWYGGPSDGCVPAAFDGTLDDLAISDSKYSQHELQRFVDQRGFSKDHRVIWPATPNWATYGTQEIAMPLGAALLQAQLAELDVASRLVEHMSYETQAACAGLDLDARKNARTDLDTIIARVSRVVRQSIFVDELTMLDLSPEATDQRNLFWTKRSTLISSMRQLTGCDDPYGIGDNEVPLYFGGIAPAGDEKDAFFAASDYMLSQAEAKQIAAKTAFDTLLTNWNNARLSQIQQLEDTNQRQIRVDDITTKYGEDLRRLCGISDQSANQVIASAMAGTFHVDSCFVAPGSSCAQNVNRPIKDADPACYRGVIGSAVLDIQSAYKAQDTAYQAWQVASDNAAAAQRVCILKEVDLFGCSALDRHDITGVTCPAGHQGTIDLVAAYNKAAADHEADKGFFSSVVSVVKGAAEFTTAVGVIVASGGTAAAVVGAGVIAGGTGLLGADDWLSATQGRTDDSIDAQKRDLDAMLQTRSAEDGIRSCWQQSDQYQRAISVAQLSFKESTAKVQSALLAFQNSVSAANGDVMQGATSISQEQNRPAAPIAFNYWVPQNYATYKAAFETARRYAYIALRATEYDTQDNYATAQQNKPSRGEVLSAWSPDALLHQLQLMRAQTATRKLVNGHVPALEHMTFDLGTKFFALKDGDPNFGTVLASYVRPVYSTHGEYLGQGMRFSLIPEAIDDAPTWRCGERIWRVNLGSSGLPVNSDGTHVKILKSNTFTSRLCNADGFQIATLRPSVNLLADNGDPATALPEDANTPADIRLTDFDISDSFTHFKTDDTYLNGSSSELALEGMYGNYVLLFPAASLSAGLDLTQLHDFLVRFDFLSVDNTPAATLASKRSPSVKFDASPATIVVP